MTAYPHPFGESTLILVHTDFGCHTDVNAMDLIETTRVIVTTNELAALGTIDGKEYPDANEAAFWLMQRELVYVEHTETSSRYRLTARGKRVLELVAATRAAVKP